MVRRWGGWVAARARWSDNKAQELPRGEGAEEQGGRAWAAALIGSRYGGGGCGVLTVRQLVMGRKRLVV